MFVTSKPWGTTMPKYRNTVTDVEVYDQVETHQGAQYYAELLGLPVYVKE